MLIEVRKLGNLRHVRINRADKKNALNEAMYAALADALEGANTDDAIRAILISGVPGAFSAGNDLHDFQRMTESGTGLGAPVLRFLHALARCEKPLVAAVQGVAVGIGTTMLLHCDYVVAATDAKFMTPFVSLGLVPEAGSSLIVPRLMGHRRAFALLVMGQPLTPQDAKACGLVNTIAEPDETDAEALKAAQHIASLPAEAVAASRRLLRGSPEEIAQRIDDEAQEFRVRLRSDEARAAFAAFFSRKKS